MDAKRAILEAVYRVPEIEGPIPVTADSHPFCAMLFSRTPEDPARYGYEEHEYFTSGFVNIYISDEHDYPVVKKSGLPYKNRILVRRPRNMAQFSGRVYLDILNATQGYDIEDLWHRNYIWCMQNGHGYVGITSKPVNVASLKQYDYRRYRTLNWSNGEEVPRPAVLYHASIPGTEEGMLWDMLGQLASLLRTGGKRNCFEGYPVEYVYLTGQSQSGAYLNTYIHYFDSFLTEDTGKKLFDGYMNIVGAEIHRNICQEDDIKPLTFQSDPIRPVSTPFISITSEGDVPLFQKYFHVDSLKTGIVNSDTPDNKRRHYEIAGTPHTDIICPLLSSLEEIKRTGRTLPDYSGKRLENLNDFPTEYYIVGLLEKLHIWAAQKTAPAVAELFKRTADATEILRDEHGNALGGLRSPFLDVPIASYLGCSSDDPEGISGKIFFFSREKMKTLYGSFENYLKKFSDYTCRQITEGWVTKKDGEKMIQWAKEAEGKLPS